jgi:hypothetical protein
MTAGFAMPHLSLDGEEDREERRRRMLQAFDVMCAVVRILWPGDGTSADPDAVRWAGAVLGLHEVEGHLYVAWKDEDHFDTFAKVVELAWTAIGFESGRVIHENADETGLSLPQTAPMF